METETIFKRNGFAFLPSSRLLLKQGCKTSTKKIRQMTLRDEYKKGNPNSFPQAQDQFNLEFDHYA